MLSYIAICYLKLFFLFLLFMCSEEVHFNVLIKRALKKISDAPFIIFIIFIFGEISFFVSIYKRNLC